jgi:hypothetical protein
MTNLAKVGLVALLALGFSGYSADAQTNQSPPSKDAGKQFDQAGKDLGSGAERVGEGIKQGAIQVWEAVKSGAQTVGDKFNGSKPAQNEPARKSQ